MAQILFLLDKTERGLFRHGILFQCTTAQRSWSQSPSSSVPYRRHPRLCLRQFLSPSPPSRPDGAQYLDGDGVAGRGDLVTYPPGRQWRLHLRCHHLPPPLAPLPPGSWWRRPTFSDVPSYQLLLLLLLCSKTSLLRLVLGTPPPPAQS